MPRFHADRVSVQHQEGEKRRTDPAANRRCWLKLLCAGWLMLAVMGLPGVAAAADETTWQAGFARIAITPDEPIFLSGYGGRDHPAEGKIHDLYARSAAFRDPSGKTAVFVALDLVGVPLALVEPVARHVQDRYGIDRGGLMVTCSHTHCGPALDDELTHMMDLAMSDEDWRKVRQYQRTLNARVMRVIDQAMAGLQPVRLAYGHGRCGFAANRRPPIGVGPYDHDVPVLAAWDRQGKLRGVVFGYACHATTLSFYKWCGDWPGFAALDLEDRHPGAVALFFAGCGADQNPLPRRSLELAQKYGRMLALAVEEVLEGRMRPIRGRLGTAFRTVELEFAVIPSRDELERQLHEGNRYEKARAPLLLAELEKTGRIRSSYPYPIQVWRMGDELLWVALGGEVVVDYALRLKRELGASTTFVAGYANDVMAYIPSERVLAEGGYEGGGSMIVYQLPGPWKSGLEDRIVATVREMAASLKPAH